MSQIFMGTELKWQHAKKSDHSDLVMVATKILHGLYVAAPIPAESRQ